MSVGDIYQLTTHYLHNTGVSANNVWYYEVSVQGGSLDAENVADEFITEVLPLIAALWPNNWSCNRVYCINGMDNEDFNDTNPAVSGAVGGTGLPSFLAIALRSNWPGPGTRRGTKRIPGGVTSAMDDNGVWTGGFVTDIQALTVQLGLSLEMGGGQVAPVTIQGNFQLGVTPVFNRNLLGQWEYNQRVMTQVTRKSTNLWTAPP